MKPTHEHVTEVNEMLRTASIIELSPDSDTYMSKGAVPSGSKRVIVVGEELMIHVCQMLDDYSRMLGGG